MSMLIGEQGLGGAVSSSPTHEEEEEIFMMWDWCEGQAFPGACWNDSSIASIIQILAEFLSQKVGDFYAKILE